jgi:hypothetical protein
LTAPLLLPSVQKKSHSTASSFPVPEGSGLRRCGSHLRRSAACVAHTIAQISI